MARDEDWERRCYTYSPQMKEKHDREIDEVEELLRTLPPDDKEYKHWSDVLLNLQRRKELAIYTTE